MILSGRLKTWIKINPKNWKHQLFSILRVVRSLKNPKKRRKRTIKGTKEIGRLKKTLSQSPEFTTTLLLEVKIQEKIGTKVPDRTQPRLPAKIATKMVIKQTSVQVSKAQKLISVYIIFALVTCASKKALMAQVTKKEVILDWLPCIYYPVYFQKDKTNIQALINSSTEVNTMISFYAK